MNESREIYASINSSFDTFIKSYYICVNFIVLLKWVTTIPLHILPFTQATSNFPNNLLQNEAHTG